MIDLEFVLTKDLHITPDIFDKMPFYESMYLYKKYEKWIEDQEKENKIKAEEYEAQRNEYQPPKIPDYTKNFKPPDMNSFTKGFTMPQMPKF